MKKTFKSIFMAAVALVAAAALSVSCSDSSENLDNPTPPEPAVSTLELSVDKGEIVADGEQAATFTVKLIADGKSSDVTSSADIYCLTTEKGVGATFSTSEEGVYEFIAMYGELTSKSVEVTAKKSDTPGNPDKPQLPYVEPETDHANVPTPIKWEVYHAQPTDPTAGVEIEVTGIQNKNFQFVCRPGELVQSYRLDVFPLCRLYNSLLEGCLGGDATRKADWSTVEDAILSFVFNSTGSGGYIMSPSTQGDEYLEYEYDWMNTQYSQAKVVPHSEYVIVAVGCFDSEGAEPAEMTICYVQTPGEELVGDPSIEIFAEVGYRSFIVSNYPNRDCKYMYYWCSNESDLMPYINGYGTKQYIDFMRHTLYDPISAAEPEDPYNDPRKYYQNFGQTADSTVPIMATAIALDENETPAKNFNSKVFTLLPIPELEEGEATLTVNPDRISSHLLWFDYTIDANAHSMLITIMTEEQAAEYKDADEETLRALALSINDNGWGINNKNYSTDNDGNPNGQSQSGSQFWMQGPNDTGILEPGATYVFAYIARNAATELSTPKFTEPFTMDAEVKDAPESCKSNAKLVLSSNDRQKLYFNFENDDFENTAAIYFQYIEPVYDDEAGQPSRDASRETFLEWLVYDQFTNNWACEPNEGFGTYTAIMEPGTKYVYAFVVEDWNGVLSEVQFAEAETLSATGGANPKVEIDYTVEDGVCYVTFQSNNDSERMKYMTGDSSTPALALQFLGDEDEFYAEDFIAQWKLYVAEYGLSTQSTSTSSAMPMPGTPSNPYVALAISYGRDTNGQEVMSDLAYVIYDGGDDVKTLRDYYPSYTGYSKGVPVPYALSEAQLFEQQSELLPASQMKRAKRSVKQSEIVEQGEAVRYIWLDMPGLGKHPHAKAR